ncbi:MAG: TolC family protein, partial [Thiobacillaceae bacterium]|nr:TolC family protein [Thiobacillaceae bacterium]
MSKLLAGLVLAWAGALLAGCAGFSPDGGMDRVQGLVQERLGSAPQRLDGEAGQARLAQEVERLLAVPLTPDAAVKIALLNHRGLQAQLAELKVAEARLVAAGRPRNPGFVYGRFAQGEEREFERTFLVDLMGLITLPVRSEIERRRFAQVQLDTARQALALAQEVRAAWFDAVAAQEGVRHLEAAVGAAAAGAELAARMRAVGNFSRQRQLAEQLQYAELAAELARARHEATVARERLARLLGLRGAQRAYQLPETLPELPEELMAEGAALQHALDGRLDLMIAREELAGLARNLGLTRRTGLVNVLEVGWLNSTASHAPVKRGYEIELRLPIFDWGEARTAQAQALYTQALHRAAQLAVEAESEVLAVHASYRTAWALARHYRDEVLPLTERLMEEAQLRYNGMLIDVWGLLAQARARAQAARAATEATRDFWLAEANLRRALDGTGAVQALLARGGALALGGE